MGKSQKQKIAESIQREELARGLQRIIKHAKQIKENKRELHYSYDCWCTTNEMTIKSLKELRDKIMNANTAANAVHSVASIVEILGDVLSIAGAVSDKRDWMEVENKITKGGEITNVGTHAIKNISLKDLCSQANKNFQNNKECSDSFERNSYSYFQALEAFKRELKAAKANYSLPLLLETAEREKIDFLGDLRLDDVTKSELRTSLRKMCRSNSKKIKAKSENIGTQEVCRVFASEIRRLLYEFKELIYEDECLFSIFSQETKKFLSDNVDNLIPYLDTAESWLGQHSGMDLLRGGTFLSLPFGFSSPASQTEIGVIGVHMASSIADLIMRINDIEKVSTSKDSEELTERIEEMEETRKRIIKAMRENFGWREPLTDKATTVPRFAE